MTEIIDPMLPGLSDDQIALVISIYERLGRDQVARILKAYLELRFEMQQLRK